MWYVQNCVNDGCSNPAEIFYAVLTFFGGVKSVKFVE